MGKIEELQKEELLNKTRSNPYHQYEAYLEECETHPSQVEGEMRGKKFKQIVAPEAGLNLHPGLAHQKFPATNTWRRNSVDL